MENSRENAARSVTVNNSLFYATKI